jgi:putative MFS transporter
MTSATVTRTPTTAEFFDRLDASALTSGHLIVAVVCALGLLFDVSEMALGGGLSAIFAASPYNTPQGQLAWLLSSVYVGATVGALLLGFMADRLGRRRILMLALFTQGLASTLAAMVSDPLWLSVFRGLSGLGLGAYPPIMIAFLTDILPARWRARIIMGVVSIAYLGPPSGIFLLRWATDARPFGMEGWQSVYLVFGIAAFIVAALFCLVPESPRWYFATGQVERAKTAMTRLFQSAPIGQAASVRPPDDILDLQYRLNARHAVLVATLSFLSTWATVAFPLLTGAVLIKLGFNLADTLLFVGISNFGPVAGAFVSSFFADRIARRTAILLFGAIMVISGLVFSASTERAGLMVMIVIFNTAATLYSPALTIYASELFPTRVRALITSLAWGMNRLGAALAPLFLLPVLHQAGTLAMCGVIALAMALSMMLVFFGPRGAAGQPVDRPS